MHPYPECYRDEIVETQGNLFSLVADLKPPADVDDFITAYIKSRTRAFIDRADAYLSNLDARELYAYFCQSERYEPKAGGGFPGFAPDWIGRFYAFFQWSQNCTSAEAIEKVPLAFLKSAYRGLHDLDLDLAVRKVAGEVDQHCASL